MNQEQLTQLAHYDPETGVFTRLCGVKRGHPAGSVKPNGYVRINFGRGPLYAAHRLAWLYMTGEWPKHQIDHINRVRSDNRFCNLRDVSVSLNALNKGAAGVSWDKRKKKWRFDLRFAGQRVWGRRSTREEAASAYLAAKDRLLTADEQAAHADRGSRSVSDLSPDTTTVFVDSQFSEVEKQNAPGVVS